MGFDDVELNGLTVGELDELAQDLDSCLSVDPNDVSCLGDAHRVARGTQKLIDRDRLVDRYLEVLQRNLDVVKTAIERIQELRS
jgi:hypothetical protein